MKIKNKAKLNIFAMLGWLVWKLLSLFGSRTAKMKLEQHRERKHQANDGPIQRGIRTLTGHSTQR